MALATSKNASPFASIPLPLSMGRKRGGSDGHGSEIHINSADENETDKGSFPWNSSKNTASSLSRHVKTSSKFELQTSIQCLEKGSEQLNLVVSESKSSASHSFVIRKWATKYDTEEKDNYDSDDDEGVLTETVCYERRNSVEEGKGTKKSAFALHERHKISTWNCGVAGVIDSDRKKGLKEHQGSTSTSIHCENDHDIAATRRGQVRPAPVDYKETKNSIWTCEGSKLLPLDNRNANTVETQEKQDIHELHDNSNDDDSSAAWFLNTFHSSDQLVSATSSNRKLTMIGSHSLSKDHGSTQRGVEETISTHQDAMIAELDPLVFELDSLSARKEKDEEVVFHEGNCEDGSDSEDVRLSKPEIDMSTSSTNRTESQSKEMLLRVTGAITSMCLTPRAQQQLLDEQIKAIGDLSNISRTDSTSIEDPNIELELRCSGNKNEADEIIVVDAVARALRRSKEKIANKNLNLEKEPIEESKTKINHNKISSDAMDVLMSLTLMECGESINRNTSNRLPVENVPSTSKRLEASVDKETFETEATEAMDVLAMLHATDDNTSSFQSKDRDTQGASEFSLYCRNKNTVGRSEFVEREGSDDVAKFGHRKIVNENQARIDTFSSQVTMPLESERKERKDGVERFVHETNTTAHKEDNHCLSVATSKACNETNPNIFEPKMKECEKFQKNILASEELELKMDSDSFSIDGFCDNSLPDDNPIRAKPWVTPKKIETKNSTKKEINLQSLRYDFNTISNAMSNSFELVTSIPSSDDCRIPSPPQLRKARVCTKQKRGQESLDFHSPPKRFSLPLDPTNTPNLPLQNDTIPISSKDTTLNLPSSLLVTSNKKRLKKKKHSRRIRTLSATAIADESHFPSTDNPGKHNIALMDPTTTTPGESTNMSKKIFSKLAMNIAIQNGKIGSAVGKETLLKSPKPAPHSVREESSQEVKFVNIAAKDRLRNGRKLCLLASTSTSIKRFDASIDNNEEDRENRSPNPYNAEASRPPSFGRRSKKGILRVTIEGAQKLPSNPNRSSVHWDEKQLANKVQKGVMVGVSSRKCRPIRVLQKHMPEIAAVQDGYGSELECLLGLRSTSKGYIC